MSSRPGYNRVFDNKSLSSLRSAPSQTPSLPNSQELLLGGRRNMSHSRPRTLPDFMKQSRNGDVTLRLARPDIKMYSPTYGLSSSVDGSVDLSKTDGITSIEAKLEGTLRLLEVAGSGGEDVTLCTIRTLLWVKDRSNGGRCPPSHLFSLQLPLSFAYGNETFPLPPTYEAHLSGVPGFRATVAYSVSVTVNRPTIFGIPGINSGVTSVNIPFTYLPRTRPSLPLPAPFHSSRGPSAEWRTFLSTMKARSPGGQDIIAKLYLPSSRIFCVKQSIPFYLIYTSSSFSLAAFLPLAPTASVASPTKQFTKIALLRQANVDVQNVNLQTTKTNMWTVDKIGEGVFRHAGDGNDWMSFSGEIHIQDSVRTGGFQAAGFSLKDYILFATDPPDPTRAPFSPLRLVIPVRLTTDVYLSADGGSGGEISMSVASSSPAVGANGIDVGRMDGPAHDMSTSDFSIPSDPGDNVEDQQLFYPPLPSS